MSVRTPYLTLPHWPVHGFREAAGTPLERVLPLLARMGHPERRLPPVVHVAGTNGKGSTLAFLRAMLEAGGYRVHAYTSPHLHRFNERIVLAGRTIGDEELHAVIEQARLAAGEDLAVEFFEGTTAAAFHAFSRQPADVLLLETGIGGRFDAANVIENPMLSIITTISQDHSGVLGRTLGEIAWHKSGILREGVPCVVSFQPPEALSVIRAEAEKVRAPLLVYGEHWAVRRTKGGMEYISAGDALELPAPSLPGLHQVVNAGNAVAAATLLHGFDLSGEAVAAGIAGARWPGRLERLEKGYAYEKLQGESRMPFELWMDGAHNSGGCSVLGAWVEQAWRDKPLHLLFGATAGRDYGAMLAPLAPFAEKIVAVPVISEPDYASAAAIASAAAAAGVATLPCESLGEALAAAAEGAEAPFRVLAYGSLYLRSLLMQG